MWVPIKWECFHWYRNQCYLSDFTMELNSDQFNSLLDARTSVRLHKWWIRNNSTGQRLDSMVSVLMWPHGGKLSEYILKLILPDWLGILHWLSEFTIPWSVHYLGSFIGQQNSISFSWWLGDHNAEEMIDCRKFFDGIKHLVIPDWLNSIYIS